MWRDLLGWFVTDTVSRTPLLWMLAGVAFSLVGRAFRGLKGRGA